MHTGKITAKALIALLPTDLIEEKARETKVNFQVKKLTGETMFQLMLMGILDSERISLRIMEDLYKSKRFKIYANLEEGSTTRHTSLSDRLANIKVNFFEEIFNASYNELSRHFKPSKIKGYDLLRYDSTFISAPAKLLSIGMENGSRRKEGDYGVHQMKITIGFNGLFPNNITLYKEQSYINDDLAIGEILLSNKIRKEEVLVFDRGIRKRGTFEQIHEQEKLFVTRLTQTKNYKIIRMLNSVEGQKTSTLKLMSDEEIYLFHGQSSKKTKMTFRLIRANSLIDGQELLFLTNIRELTAKDITEIYRSRWDIEVFFRFLKQEMNFKHFLSYNENGIKVMVYMTLIAAMLIMIYKKQNEISSYKRAKQLFVEALDTEIVRAIVVICGGDPDISPLLTPT
jgi:hypothetical protein